MDEEINNDGYVSIWDISNIGSPILINRLGPGNGLPEDFNWVTLYILHRMKDMYMCKVGTPDI